MNGLDKKKDGGSESSKAVLPNSSDTTKEKESHITREAAKEQGERSTVVDRIY